MRIVKVQTCKLDRRLAEPSVIAYKTIRYARNGLVLLETDEDQFGVGELSPLKPVTGDTRDEALRFVGYVSTSLKGSDPTDIARVHSILEAASRKIGFMSQTASAAIDSACFDIIGKSVEKPVYKILGCHKPRMIPNAVTIYLRSLKDTAKNTRELMRRYGKNGLQRLKLKLSGNPRLDKARVLTVSEIFPGDLMLDANQAYRDEKSAVKVLNDIYDAVGSKVILVEQPSPKDDLQKLKGISSKCKIPVFADEAVVTMKDLQKIIRSESADGVNIKLQKAGGIFWGCRMAELAKDHGLEIMVGCMMESEIGIAQDAHFLAGISNDVVASDLDTDLEIKTEIVTPSSRVPFRDGARIPLDRPGLGVELHSSCARRLREWTLHF
ncbi:MAG: enolase C-terminal domain-like protein [Candidatus Bathyarchaeia archaeon]